MGFIFTWGKYSRRRQKRQNYPLTKISMFTVSKLKMLHFICKQDRQWIDKHAEMYLAGLLCQWYKNMNTEKCRYYQPFENPSEYSFCLISSGTGPLTPAPQATRGVRVSEGCPAPWEPQSVMPWSADITKAVAPSSE